MNRSKGTAATRWLSFLVAGGMLGVGCAQGDPVGRSEQANLVEEEADACVAHTTTIFAGQHIDAGSATVASDGTNLIVTIQGANGWLVEDYHVYAGPGPVPVTDSGAAAPGQFPYHGDLAGPVAMTTLTVPLADLGAECGDSLVIAIHTVMVRIVDGVVVDTQTGWGYGPNTFRRAWGWWFTVDLCCEPPNDCVRSKSAWREVPQLWPLASFTIGGVTYSADDALALLFIRSDDIGGDASLDLFHQMIAAMLNIADGAVPGPATADALTEADAWMVTYADADGTVPYGIHPGGWGLPPDPGYEAGEVLKWELHAFNVGEAGSPTCVPEYR